jgi:hypothetical protein
MVQYVNTLRTFKFVPSENPKLMECDGGSSECKKGT